MVLQTAVNDALCGVNLNLQTRYLFNLRAPTTARGGVFDGSPAFDVGLCDSPIVWRFVSKENRMFLRNGVCKKSPMDGAPTEIASSE